MGPIFQKGWTGSCLGIGNDQRQTGNVALKDRSGISNPQRTKLEDSTNVNSHGYLYVLNIHH
jgi:hypothetical protein